MDFGKFGIKSFTAETKVKDFVAYLEQGKVMATRCKGCGNLSFPPKMDCTKCGTEEVEWVEVKEPGTISTFTTVFYGPAGFEKETPYTIAIADFPEGVQMMGHIDKSLATENVKVGMKVKVRPVTRDDRFWYQFGPA